MTLIRLSGRRQIKVLNVLELGADVWVAHRLSIQGWLTVAMRGGGRGGVRPWRHFASEEYRIAWSCSSLAGMRQCCNPQFNSSDSRQLTGRRARMCRTSARRRYVNVNVSVNSRFI